MGDKFEIGERAILRINGRNKNVTVVGHFGDFVRVQYPRGFYASRPMMQVSIAHVSDLRHAPKLGGAP